MKKLTQIEVDSHMKLWVIARILKYRQEDPDYYIDFNDSMTWFDITTDCIAALHSELNKMADIYNAIGDGTYKRNKEYKQMKDN